MQKHTRVHVKTAQLRLDTATTAHAPFTHAPLTHAPPAPRPGHAAGALTGCCTPKCRASPRTRFHEEFQSRGEWEEEEAAQRGKEGKEVGRGKGGSPRGREPARGQGRGRGGRGREIKAQPPTERPPSWPRRGGRPRREAGRDHRSRGTRGRAVGSPGGDAWGRGEVRVQLSRQGQGQLTRAQLTGNPETVVMSRQRLGTWGVGTGGQCGGSGVPCRPGPARCLPGIGETSGERAGSLGLQGSQTRGPWALVTGQQTCVQLFFL